MRAVPEDRKSRLATSRRAGQRTRPHCNSKTSVPTQSVGSETAPAYLLERSHRGEADRFRATPLPWLGCAREKALRFVERGPVGVPTKQKFLEPTKTAPALTSSRAAALCFGGTEGLELGRRGVVCAGRFHGVFSRGGWRGDHPSVVLTQAVATSFRVNILIARDNHHNTRNQLKMEKSRESLPSAQPDFDVSDSA